MPENKIMEKFGRNPIVYQYVHTKEKCSNFLEHHKVLRSTVVWSLYFCVVVLFITVTVLLLYLIPMALEHHEPVPPSPPPPVEYCDPIILKSLIASALDETVDLAPSRLEYLVDMFGARISGSASLAAASQWLYSTLVGDQLDGVELEFVEHVSNWTRGNESAAIVAPYFKRM